MTYANQIKNDYFEWLYNYACKGRINNSTFIPKCFPYIKTE